MNKDELIKRLQDVEWDDFEVKKAEKGIPKNSWETVSAFSNTGGGWLVFGVHQTGKNYSITGLTNPEKIEQDFNNTLRSKEKFNIMIQPICKKYSIDGKTILAFFISVSDQKPVYFNNVKNTFIRTGSGDQRATQAEIDAMYRDQSFGTKDRELTGFDTSALHQKSIDRYRNYLANRKPSHPYNLFSTDQLLDKLQVVNEDKVTIAGLLFFGKVDFIDKFLTDFRIDYFEIPGSSLKDASERYTFRLDQQENIFEYYFAIFPRLLQKIDIPFKMTLDGMASEEQPHIEALREALVNMLMHADYFSTSKPRVRVFNDHLQFFNPGGLPQDLETLRKSDISQPRNPILAKIFRVIGLAETSGYGFDKIFNGWKTYVKEPPEYQYRLTFVELKLTTQKKMKLGEKLVDGLVEKLVEDHKLTQNQSKILKLMLENNRISISLLSENIGISTTAIDKNISRLKKLNVLQRIGSDKGGYWKVVSLYK